MLVKMKHDVVLLNWCSDWKNVLQFFDNKHGPGYLLLQMYVNPTSGKKMTPQFTSSNGQTIQMRGIFCRSENEITGIKSLIDVKMNDWVWLIKHNYAHECEWTHGINELEQKLQWCSIPTANQTRIYADKARLKLFYLEEQEEYKTTQSKN